jgi:hypothetical protein
MNALTFLYYGDVSSVGQEDDGQGYGVYVVCLFVCLVCLVCLFLGGSRGCAIATVALVTINEDQDHRVPEPSASLHRIPENYRQGNERTEDQKERQCCRDILYTK